MLDPQQAQIRAFLFFEASFPDSLRQPYKIQPESP